MDTTMMLTVGGFVLAVVGIALGFVGHFQDQRLRNTGEWKKLNAMSIVGGILALVGIVALLVGTVVIS